MKLAYIGHTHVPSSSASSVQVVKMCKAFASNSHNVRLFVPKSPIFQGSKKDTFNFYGINRTFDIDKVSTVPTSIGKVTYYFQAVIRAWRLNFDLIYSRSIIPCYISASLGIPTIFESHAPFENRRFGSFRNSILERTILKEDFRALIVISSSLNEYYSKRFEDMSKKILTAHDGADPISDSTEPKSFDGSFNIGYVGNLYHGKGIDILQDVAQACPDIQFHIVGEINTQLTNQPPNLNFHGYIPHGEIPRYLIGLDVFLAPYEETVTPDERYDISNWMSPLKIFEYMSAGKPIICSDIPVLHEILTDNETALLCDPNDINQWVGAIRKLENNKNLREELGNHARSEFLENYTWDERALKILTFINKD